jgi:hypothetical protein
MLAASSVCLCSARVPPRPLQKQRSHQKHDFFRRTKTGQPVMKVRVDKILATLQQEKQQQQQRR